MGVEAYAVKTSMVTDIAQTLSGIRSMTEAYAGLGKQLQGIIDLQKQVGAAMAAGGSAFATSMAAGASSAQAAATAMTAAADKMTAAAKEYVQLSLPALQPQPWQGAPPAGPAGQLLLFPSPSTQGVMQAGPPPPPGTALVYSGPGRQWDYAGPSPNRGGLGPANAAGGVGGYGRGGGPGDPNYPGADEPFGRGPINLYNPTGARPGYGDYMMAGYGARMAGDAASGLAGGSFMAAAGVDQLKGGLAAMGFSKEQVGAAYAAAVETQKNVMGTYVGQNLELIVKLAGLTQDANLSIQMLPEMARAQQVFSGMGRNGPAEVYAALQSAELRGILFSKDASGKETPNVPAISQFLKNMEAITAMSGGRYGPGEILQLLKSGGVAAAIMSDENGFAEMMPFIQSMGAPRAGTALRAFSQQFSAGKMSDAAVGLLADMGIIKDPSKMAKAGTGQWQLRPGAMGTGDFVMANLHPEQFILERLLPAVDRYAAKNYGSVFTKGDANARMAIESAVMQQLASRIPGGVFDAEAVRLAPLMARDVAAYHRQQGGDAYTDTVTNNPLMQLQGYRAAVNALMVTLGEDNMKVSIAAMQALTAALNGMQTVFAKDPILGPQLMLVADALKVVASVAGPILVMAPAIMAAKKIMTSVGGAGAGAGLGGAIVSGGALALVPAIASAINSALKWGQDKEFDWLAKHGVIGPSLMRDKNAGMSDKDLSAKYHITVNNYLDGKEIGGAAVKTIVHGANGPSTGSGDFDGRQNYTPTEH